MRTGYVYIMTNQPRGTLYLGFTLNLVPRVSQHKNGVVEGFTDRYGLKRLVWFESGDNVGQAMVREKQLKKWNRVWKICLVEVFNPDWSDLYETITGNIDSRLGGNDGAVA